MVASGATLRLGAGTYNIGSLTLGSNASLVAPSGGVRLNIGSSLTLNAGAAQARGQALHSGRGVGHRGAAQR